MNSTENRLLTVPLGIEAHSFARQFAGEQINPQKGKRVYLNTLSVYAVHSYLKWFEIETNLTLSDCWNPHLRSIFDVADLVITNVGKLECRPVLPGQTALPLPLEVTENRIGYLAVQFSDRLDAVQLLGFAPAATEPPQLQISNLQPVENVLDCLVPHTASTTSSLYGLSQWLENIFEPGWQALTELFTSERVNLGYARSSELLETDTRYSTTSISRFKQIDLGMKLESRPIALIVKVTPLTEEEIEVRVQVRPMGQIYLPQGITLSVLDESGLVVLDDLGNPLKEQAGDSYDLIQLTVSGDLGESFSVRLTLEEASITQDFTI